ncbi:uncharacterized protein C8A04DRAFT_33463 [Dichotomopilus funicola]|uniref:Uncharacterized protein n=1 Tax=Dichotomopilus funicola TaxID=1934379 RepID=A0AAN6UUA6_9PEZI|nr:hypothetical protein C8A04DRAFT_33463 [Dichotomopilus funicola]
MAPSSDKYRTVLPTLAPAPAPSASPALSTLPILAPAPPRSSTTPSTPLTSTTAATAAATAAAAMAIGIYPEDKFTSTSTSTTITTGPDEDLWPAIERNYFSQMARIRSGEDAALAAEHVSRAETLRTRLLANFNAQKSLMLQLDALRRDYDEYQAQLEGLDPLLAQVRAERAREREKEDRKKREWFRWYRRGGLGYANQAGIVDGSGGGEEEQESRKVGDRDVALDVASSGLSREDGLGNEQFVGGNTGNAGTVANDNAQRRLSQSTQATEDAGGHEEESSATPSTPIIAHEEAQEALPNDVAKIPYTTTANEAELTEQVPEDLGTNEAVDADEAGQQTVTATAEDPEKPQNVEIAPNGEPDVQRANSVQPAADGRTSATHSRQNSNHSIRSTINNEAENTASDKVQSQVVDEDIEMVDAETQPIEEPEAPKAVPAAAPSLASSSDLSSRNTTPDLDTPVSMSKEPTTAVESPRQPSAPESRRESLGSVRSPARTRLSGGSFASTVSLDHSRDSIEAVSVDGNGGEANKEASPKKGPRKPLPGARRVPLPSTSITTSFSAQEDKLPEINKAVLSVKHDGVVFTDPPIIRGVPLAKISPDHPYWEPSWPKIEDLSGSTHRDKHLANRDAKLGRTILKFLKDGELHPYQLVGKEWINTRITNYDTLFRLVQLLTEELPKMNLDVTPSEWLRARNGFARVGRPPAHVTKSANGETGSGSTAKKTTAARSLKRKDPHQTPDATPTRARAAVGSGTSAEQESRPTTAESSSGQSTVPNGEGQRVKKIKIVASSGQQSREGPKSNGISPSTKRPSIILKKSPTKAKMGERQSDQDEADDESEGEVAGEAEKEREAEEEETQEDKNKEKTHDSITAKSPPAQVVVVVNIHQKDNDQVDNPEEEEATSDIGSTLDYDGYTSSDSISGDRLMENEWQLHQVRTRSKGTNPRVTQYWHWVKDENQHPYPRRPSSKSKHRRGHNAHHHEDNGPNQRVVIEHQVLEDVGPIKWSVFKKPCNFHLKLADIEEVSHTPGSTKVVVTHKKGKDGRDVGPRGDVMAQFRRDRTKRRFLRFLVREMGIRVVARSVEAIEATWNSIDPEILPGPDSD